MTSPRHLALSLTSLALALALSPSHEPAHAAATLVEVDMMCPVFEVRPSQAPDSPWVVIARGSDQGIVKGARGDLYAAREGSGIGDVVARAEVVEVSATQALARVVPGSASNLALVAPGAQLELRALLPANVHRGLLFSLYTTGIEFLDNAREPIVSPRELLTATTDAVEKKALANMVAACREVVEFTLDFAQIQTRTRWKGKKVPDILANNDASDLLEFLRFVRNYAGKYVGKPWKISETYATWLINFSPPAHEDRHAELLAAKGAALAELVKNIKDDELALVMEWYRIRVDNWEGGSASAWPGIKLYEQVTKLKYGTKPPPFAKAELAHMRARAFHDTPKKELEAIAAYREASPVYLSIGDDDNTIEGIICLNNVAALLGALERDDEAIAQVAEIKRLIQAALAKTKNPMYAAHFAMAEVFPTIAAARIAQRRGQYREVIAMLSPLVDRYAQTGASGARQKEMDLLELIAKAHVKLGELAQAEALHARIAARAQELGDAARAADVAFAVGDMYYDQSRYEDSAKAFARSAEVARGGKLAPAEAKALAAEGQALWGMGKLADALARHDAAMKLREGIGDKSGIAWQLVQVAKIQVQTGDREAARAAFERALGLYQELGQASSEAEVRLELGDLHLKLMRPELAEREFAAARDVYKRLKRVVAEANAVQRMASARFKAGDDVGAEKLVAGSIKLLEKTGDKGELTAARLWLARIRPNLGDVKGARALYAQLMPKDRAKEPGTTIDVLVDLAYLELREGVPDKALALAKEGLGVAESTQDVQRTLNALHALRSVYSNQGDHAHLLEVMTRALDISKAAGNRPGMVSALQQLAWVYSDTGRLAEGKAAAEQALELARQNDDPYEEAWAYNTLSKVYQGYNDVREELRALDEAYRLMSGVNYRYGKAAIVFNRALTYARVRDLERALAGYREAEEVGGTALDTEFKVALPSARGLALLLLGRHDEAERSLTQALGLARVSNPGRVPYLLVGLARLNSERGRHDEAVKLAEEAVALDDRATSASHAARAMLGRVLAAAGRYDEAQAALATAVQRARAAGGAVPWEHLHQLALLEARRGERKAAIGLLQEAVKEIEVGESVLAEDSAARNHGDKVEVFRLLVKLLLADGQVEAGFQYLERSKVAELRDLGKRLGGADQNTALAIELDVQEKRLQKLLDAELAAPTPNDSKIKQLDELIAQVKKKRADFMESLDRNDAVFDRYAVRPLQLEKLQQYLGEGVLVIAPVVLDDSVVVFAMTKDVLTHYTTPIGAPEVDKLVTAFVREVDPKNAVGVKGKASLGRVKQQAQRLYDLFLRPAIDAVGTPKTLVLSPTGSLRYLPFVALHDGQRWLVEKTAVVNVTALDREKFAQAAPRPGPEVAVMALVDPDGTLPAAHAELAEVKKAIHKVDVFEGANASSTTLRQKLRVPGYEIVHFATHGRLDAANPELSNILLADRSLSYADIPTLAPTKTQLVVLSACQTAVLSGGSGLEIAGLAYQFQRGRVHSVLATLWEVNDAATAELMGHFYEEVQAGKSYADALAGSQRTLVASAGYEHPGYWAPFILMGTP